MSIKVIGMGNILMGDDGIGIYAIRCLNDQLKAQGWDAICCETDISYGVTEVMESDFVILLDAGLTGNNPGELTVLPIESYYKDRSNDLHRVTLIDELKRFYPDLRGYLILIEVADVGLHVGLSDELNKLMDEMNEGIFDTIKYLVMN